MDRPNEADIERGAYRPPAGLPLERQSPWGLPVSLILHALVVLLLLIPAMATGLIPSPLATGAGGAGPAGGGGGGTRGFGLKVIPERLRFLHVAPAPAPQPAQPEAVVVPEPVPPPVETKEAEPQEPVPPPSAATEPAAAIASGEGGGTGDDGSGGSGPGRGGGIGTGEGTGMGSGVGPGTGGGDATIYPPSPTQLFLPPIPAPKNVAGQRVVAEFDVDSTGRVLSVQFNPTRDRAYNAKLSQVLHEVRFRPATRLDGRPIRARTHITFELPS